MAPKKKVSKVPAVKAVAKKPAVAKKTTSTKKAAKASKKAAKIEAPKPAPVASATVEV